MKFRYQFTSLRDTLERVITALQSNFRQVEQEVDRLDTRIDGAIGGSIPTGPAGGDLSGTYPNPSVVNDSHSHDTQYYTEAEVDTLLATNATQDRARANHTGTQLASTISDFTAAVVIAILANDGAGSGLDADLLDAQTGSYYLARANHTGTQLAATISDFTSAVQTVGDARYWALSTDLATQAELDTHKSSSDHDSRYYTESEVDTLIAGRASDAELAATQAEVDAEESARALRDVQVTQDVDDLREDFEVHHHDSRYVTLSTLTGGYLPLTGGTLSAQLLVTEGGNTSKMAGSYFTTGVTGEVARAALYLDSGTTAPTLAFGNGTDAYDWVLTRTAANVASLTAGDKIRDTTDPSHADDLSRKSYVDAQVAAVVAAEAGVRALKDVLLEQRIDDLSEDFEASLGAAALSADETYLRLDTFNGPLLDVLDIESSSGASDGKISLVPQVSGDGTRIDMFKGASETEPTISLQGGGSFPIIWLGPGGSTAPDWRFARTEAGVAGLDVGSRIRDGVNPVHDSDLSRKAYVDTKMAYEVGSSEPDPATVDLWIDESTSQVTLVSPTESLIADRQGLVWRESSQAWGLDYLASQQDLDDLSEDFYGHSHLRAIGKVGVLGAHALAAGFNTITFDTVVIPGRGVTTAASATPFTCIRSGLYEVTAAGSWANAGGSRRGIRVARNTSGAALIEYCCLAWTTSDASDFAPLSASDTIYMNAGDGLAMAGYQADGADANVGSGTYSFTLTVKSVDALVY